MPALARVIPVLLLAAASFSCTAAEFPDYSFVHTTGEAYAYVAPDTAEIVLDVKLRDADAEQSLVKLNERVSALQALVGTDPSVTMYVSDIKRDSVTGGEAAGAVELKCNVRIKVDDLGRWKELIAAVLTMPDIDKLAVFFDLAKRDEMENQLLLEAGQLARKRAELIALSFGRRIAFASAISDGPLRNLSGSVGLVTSNTAASRTRRMTRATDVTSLEVLKFAKSLDIVFKTK